MLADQFQNVSPGERERIAILSDEFRKKGFDDRLTSAVIIAALCRQRREGITTEPLVDFDEKSSFREESRAIAQRISGASNLIQIWKTGSSVRTLVQKMVLQSTNGDGGLAETCGQAVPYFLPTEPPAQRRPASGFEDLPRRASRPAPESEEMAMVGLAAAAAFGVATLWWWSSRD